MNHEAYRYFITTGKPRKAIQAWQADARKRAKWREQYRKDLKADDLLFVYAIEGTEVLVGAVFEKNPGEPWRHYKKDPANYYRPNKATSKGKMLNTHLLNLSQPSTRELVKDFGARHPLTFCKDGRVRHIGIERIGDNYVVFVPKEASDFTPAKGLKEIPLSKYFAMKESRVTNNQEGAKAQRR